MRQRPLSPGSQVSSYEYPGWDDLRFPSQGINPTGAAASATRETAVGLLSFSGTVDNFIAGVAQMPHSWRAGTSIRPHVHLVPINAASGVNTRWKFEYNRANNNENFENAFDSWTELDTITVANPNNAQALLLPSGFGDLDMTGFRESCIILWRLSRLAASDAADDDTGAWYLGEFDIHYRVGKPGTIHEIPG